MRLPWLLSTLLAGVLMTAPLRGQIEGRSLTPPGFGHAIAAHGDWVLVSAPFAANSGKVFLFQREGQDHRLITILDSAWGSGGGGFGTALALDERTLVVGDKTARSGFRAGAGLVYVYDFENGKPTELPQRLSPPQPERDGAFGESVALHGDLVAIGESARYDGGRVTLFRRRDGEWKLQTVLKASELSDDRMVVAWFGSSLAMDHNTLVVAAPWTMFDETKAGAVFIYEKNDEGAYSQPPTILTWKEGQEAIHFGNRVAVRDEMLAVSCWMADVDGREDAGAVCLFVRGADGRFPSEPTQVLTAPTPRKNESFGLSLKVDGPIITIGTGAGEQGQYGVHLWAPSDDRPPHWTHRAHLTGADPESGFGGWGLSNGGSRIYVGEPYLQPYGEHPGQVAIISLEQHDDKTEYRRIGTLAMPTK